MELSRPSLARPAGSEANPKEDIEWKRWLMTKPYRPFDPQLYFEYRLYRNYSSGIPDQWMSHGIDLVHWFMDEHAPVSVLAHAVSSPGKTDEKIQIHFIRCLNIPPGSLSAIPPVLENDAPSFIRFMGKKATLMNFGTEGTPRWLLVEEKGNFEDDPTVVRNETWLVPPWRWRERPGEYRRRRSLAHDKLVRRVEQQQAAIGFCAGGIRTFGRLHHGGAILLGGKEALLGSEDGEYFGSPSF